MVEDRVDGVLAAPSRPPSSPLRVGPDLGARLPWL